MAIQTTSNLTYALRALYKSKYEMGAMGARIYDQIAVDYTEVGADGKSMDELFRSSTVYIPFMSQMAPITTAISQTQDITPQTVRDAVSSVTTTSRAGALQWAELLALQTYTDYTAKAYEIIGQNAMESIELLASAAATQGSWVEILGSTNSRSELDAGTSADRLSDAVFRKMVGKMLSLRVPGFINDAGEANTWAAIMHPYPFHDVCESGNVDSIGLYQQKGIHLNYELGQLGPFRLVVTPFAKVFYGAGADHATNVDTTLATAANALSTTIVTAADVSSSITSGELWMVGTEETGNTHYPTNERFKVLSASGTTLTILGEGPNGGLRYDHAAGESVRNADSVYTVILGGPQSLVRVYAVDIGKYGKVLEPKVTGLADQFTSLAWKYYGNYGRISENRVVRIECATSYEA